MSARLALIGLALLTACAGGITRVVVGAGTTLVDSGFLDAVVARYEATHPGVELSVVGEATAQVLALARSGEADVTITHAPDLEEAFIAEGRAASWKTIFSSHFLLAGPSDAVGGLEGLSPADAFTQIAAARHTFVSRADGSGTYLTERRIWEDAGIDPSGEDWYVETGQGMGLTLQVASQRRAFLLAEYGTFVVAGDLGLEDARIDGSSLVNPYRTMVVAGSSAEEEADRFVRWLASPEGVEAVLDTQRDIYGSVVFRPWTDVTSTG